MRELLFLPSEEVDVLRATLVVCLLWQMIKVVQTIVPLSYSASTLEKQLERAAKGNKGARGSSAKKTSSSKETGAHDAAGRGKSVSGPDTHPCGPCHICKELGHWHKDCPKRKDRSKEEAKYSGYSQISVTKETKMAG